MAIIVGLDGVLAGLMKPNDRYAWIEAAMAKLPGRCADIVNSDFVEDYVEATGARHAIQPYGASICRQLGRDLSAMGRAGRLRHRRLIFSSLALT